MTPEEQLEELTRLMCENLEERKKPNPDLQKCEANLHLANKIRRELESSKKGSLNQ